MTLEDQLAALSKLGVRLNDGVTVDDLTYSFDRGQYESDPFGLLLFVLGIEIEREPWGRYVSDMAWNFDSECISRAGDYVEIVRHLCRIAGAPDRLTRVRGHVDFDKGEAWLEYTCDGKQRRWPLTINDDWADTLTLNYVMDDIETEGRHFYFKDNGQAMVLFYLDESSAAQLNALAPDEIKRVIAE